jgi:hypothetical protein
MGLTICASSRENCILKKNLEELNTPVLFGYKSKKLKTEFEFSNEFNKCILHRKKELNVKKKIKKLKRKIKILESQINN